MPQKIIINSMLVSNRRVEVDPFGRNPIAEDAEAVAKINNFRPKGTAPKMFTAGSADVPAFTASGVDPQALLKLPYGIRHYAAGLTSQARFYALMEDYADQPGAILGHDGLAEAVRRAYDWLQDKWAAGMDPGFSREALPTSPAPTARAPRLAQTAAEFGVTPAVAAVANERGVDLAAVAGTGVGGRISLADVERAQPQR